MLNRCMESKLRWHGSTLYFLMLLIWLVGASTARAQVNPADAARLAAEQAEKKISKQATEAAKGPEATRLKQTIELATEASEAAPVWNQPFKQIANIDWSTPPTPRYVNLGGDRFLFETRKGIEQWDFASRRLQPLAAPAVTSGLPLNRLAYGGQAWARLGSTAAGTGTVFVVSSSDEVQGSLWWWNPATLSIAASLPVPGQLDRANVVQITDRYALLCDKKAGASLVQFVQRGSAVNLAWANASDPDAMAALLARGVSGSVKGFDRLELAVIKATQRPASPVYYDTTKCDWDMHSPPSELKPFFDKKTQRDVKPYFLADGSVLVPELSYHNGEHPQSIQSSYLWTPGAKEWRQLGATRGSGNQDHRTGQTEPVFATGFQSSVVEFFDTASLQWVRSVESLKISQYDWVPRIKLEPLSSGKALVMVSDTNYQGTIGVMTPARGKSAPGKLRTPVWMFGEGVLAGHQMLLVGGGTSWKPAGRVEVIDMAMSQARPLASLPADASLPVDPSLVPLPDGSVLVFGGLPAQCSPHDYFFGHRACANRSGLASTRIWPDTGRMQTLSQLKIPFNWGAYWQTGNSERTAQWPRADVVVRPNGDLVWLQGAEIAAQRDRESLPRVSQLNAWSHSSADLPARTVASLRKARNRASLINLADGRLAAIGGEAQLELVALEKTCVDCPDEFVSIGPFKPARTTELLDETDPKMPRWTVGPLANFAGGKAFKLANGRIFKLSMIGVFDSDGYRAEIADAAYTAWTKLPGLPKIDLPNTSSGERVAMLIRNVSVIGNRVLILTDQKTTLVWDDEKSAWLVWKDWPTQTADGNALSVNPSPKPGAAFVRYWQTFQTLAMPE